MKQVIALLIEIMKYHQEVHHHQTNLLVLKVVVKQQEVLQALFLLHRQTDLLLVFREEGRQLEVSVWELLPLLHHRTILFA